MQFTFLKTVFFTFSVIALSACGGGGNKPSSSVVESGVSSSSSSSGVVANCTDSVGDVFVNSVCPSWSGTSVYERNTLDHTIFREIRDGSPGDLVTLQVIDSGVAGHDQVLDIQYNSRSPEFNGVVRMFNLESAPDGKDMSSYATGKLTFDVKVISRGDEAPNLEVAIECGWPCNSHAHALVIPQLNQWLTIEVSVKELIAEGLDIEHVTTGFLIAPAWGHQANVHFQVDNIRWVKGAPEPATEAVCFANHLDFNDWDEGKNVFFFDIRSFADSVIFDYSWVQQIVPNISIKPQWELVSGIWGFAVSEPLVLETQQPLIFPRMSECTSTGSVLSAQVYLPASYVADGKMKVGLYFMDASHNISMFTDDSLSAADMTADGWTKIEVNLDGFFDLSQVLYTGVFFDANDKSPAVTGDIVIDSFVISRSLTP